MTATRGGKLSDLIVALVIARAENGAIGRDGGLPWQLSTDLKQFRKVTMGKPVIMGRATYQSLPRVLDGRVNIVLSRDPGFVAPGAIVASSLAEGLDQASLAAKDAGVDVALNDPGKPWQNGSDESFNGKLRDECLSLEWFRNRFEAKAVIETWRTHYNEDRPHSSLGYRTPMQFKRQIEEQKQSTQSDAVLN